MPGISRRKRLRERRRRAAGPLAPRAAEATALPRGDWGAAHLQDWVLVRKAIRADWPTPAPVQDAIVAALASQIGSPRPRHVLSGARSCLAMDASNLRADVRALAQVRSQA